MPTQPPNNKGKKYAGKVYRKPGSPHWHGDMYINKTRLHFKCDGWLSKREANTKFQAWRNRKRTEAISFDYQTWDYAKEKFLEYITRPKADYQPRTIAEYKYCLNTAENIIKKTFKIKFLSDLSAGILTRVSDELEAIASKKGTDNHGANKVLNSLRVFLSYAMRRGYMPAYSLEHFSALEVKPLEIKSHAETEIALMLKYSPLNWRIAILFMYENSHRPEEAANQLLDNINLKAKEGDIKENKADPARGVHYFMPKVGKERPFVLTDTQVSELKKLGRTTGYAVLNQYDKPYSQGGFSVGYKKNLENVNASIKAFEPKGTPLIEGTAKLLRKSHVTNLRIKGAEKKDISLSVGHEDTKVTDMHYTDTERKELKKVLRDKQLELLKKLAKTRGSVKYTVSDKQVQNAHKNKISR